MTLLPEFRIYVLIIIIGWKSANIPVNIDEIPQFENFCLKNALSFIIFAKDMDHN